MMHTSWFYHQTTPVIYDSRKVGTVVRESLHKSLASADGNFIDMCSYSLYRLTIIKYSQDISLDRQINIKGTFTGKYM